MFNIGLALKLADESNWLDFQIKCLPALNMPL